MKKIYLFISFLPLFIIAAFRDESVGTDASNYVRGFRGIGEAPLSGIFDLERWEPGYVLVNKISSHFSSDEQTILIVTSFLSLMGIIYFIYKNSNNIVLSVYLYISLYMYLFSFNVIRQAIAISILVVGFHFIRERRFKSYLVTVLIATLFHESAIILLGLYFIYGIKLKIKNISILIIAFIGILISIEFIIQTFLNFSSSLSYIKIGNIAESGTGFLFPLINASILIFMLYIKFTNRTDYYLDFLLFIVLLGLFSSILAMQAEVLLRINYYFIIYYIIAIPYSLKFVADKKLRFIMGYFLFVVTILYLLIRMFDGWHGIFPYIMYFEV